MTWIWRRPVVVALTIVAIVLFVAGCGFAYNELSIFVLRAIAGMPGRLYDVDGHLMHLHCSGTGSPTIVLSSGLGDNSLVWAKTQAALSKGTEVCSYDRAGLGWSDARPDVPDAKNIAEELHALIQQSETAKPIILMGHSISGVYIREYAQLYPNDLAGLVFVDGSTPLQDPLFPPVYAEIDRQRSRQVPIELAKMIFGLDRVTGRCNHVPRGFEAYASWWKANSCIPGHIEAAQRELAAVPQSGRETVDSGPFGILPILILSRDPNTRRTDMPPKDAEAGSMLWDSLQQRLLHLSTRSRRIIALKSDHYIFLDRPELVNNEVSAFVTQVRHGAAPPAPYGSTIRE